MPFADLKKQATEFKHKAAELGSEAARTAFQLKKGVQAGYEVSKSALQKAGDVLNKEKISVGIDVVAKGTQSAGKALEKVSSTMKQFSQKLKKEKSR